MNSNRVTVIRVSNLRLQKEESTQQKLQNLPHTSSQSSFTPQCPSATPSSTSVPPLVKQTTTQKKKRNPQNLPSTTKCSTRKKTLLGFLIVAIICAVIVAIVLSVLLTRKAETTTTTTSTTIVSAYWSFDGITTDLYGVYNGHMVNGATYVAASSTYFGYGQALSLNSSLNQSFQVSTPFLNLSYTSFTIEAWIYSPTGFTGDNYIFSQCQCSTCANQCLYFIVRASHLYIGFTANDLSGSTTLTSLNWYHIAFVYNYQNQQQILYLNGIQENLKSNAQPYQGTNGTVQIGSTQVFLTTNYFNGYIDNVKVVTRAKSAAEINNDGSLTAYYSFDFPYPTNDNGPNGLNGTSMNTATVTGRVNQAMLFTGSTSYFQAYGFYQVYGVYSNKPFSISLWIKPALASGCNIIQQSVGQTNGTCMNMIGISSVTGSTGQIIVQGYAWLLIYGPFIVVNTWTHISWTYSSTNGYTLYVNGILFGSTGATGFGNSGSITWIQIGNSINNCQNGYISSTTYQGLVDEVYVHNRELSQADVTALANP